MAGHQTLDRIPTQPPAATARKHRSLRLARTLPKPHLHDPGCFLAKGSASLFSPLPLTAYVGSCPQDHVFASQSDQFGYPQPRLNRDQQQGLVPASDPSRCVGRGDKGLNLLAGQVFDRPALVAFVRDGQDLTTPVGLPRLVEGDVPEEGMDGGQSHVAGPRTVPACFLDVLEKLPDEGGVQILEQQIRRAFPKPCGGKAQEKPEGVPVSGDRVGTGLSLPHEAVGEESLQESREACAGPHGPTSLWRSAKRRAANSSNSGTASMYQKVSLTCTCPR